ncbi:MAG: hypothetical protein OXE53_15390 [Deltaproteobacteria bacterium]|nr:hypothetical protein [Deltaproteobacteria bacterium]
MQNYSVSYFGSTHILSYIGGVCYDLSMTEAIAFDTHRFLTESGFTEKQAETLAEEHVALLNANLATKAEFAAVKADIANVEANMEPCGKEVGPTSRGLRPAWMPCDTKPPLPSRR